MSNSRPQRVNTCDTLEWRVLIHKICDILDIRMLIKGKSDNLISWGWGAHYTLCKLYPERVKGSLHTGWTSSFRPSYGWRAHCTLPAKSHLKDGWGLAAHWLNPYLSKGMSGPLHARYTSSIRRNERPTAHRLNLILRMDEGLVSHWVNHRSRENGSSTSL